MRYRLRTLLIVLALGPPMLAALWAIWQAPRSDILDLFFVPLFLVVLAAIPLALVAIPIIFGFVLARIADVILFFRRHPDNRQ